MVSDAAVLCSSVAAAGTAFATAARALQATMGVAARAPAAMKNARLSNMENLKIPASSPGISQFAAARGQVTTK
jgi:hypothetical protein